MIRHSFLIPLLLVVLVAGCDDDDIETTYGRRSGMGASSVNGTRVLSEMFELAGHQVTTAGRLTPKLRERADVIVWFPNDFEPPSKEVREWLDEWLCEWGKGRTLIYVGRDFDAARVYWNKVQAGAPAGQIPELKRREGAASNRVYHGAIRTRTTTPTGSRSKGNSQGPRCSAR